MAIYKKIKGAIVKVASDPILRHNDLTGRDEFGCHKIQAIRGLPEKLTNLKTITTQHSQQIDDLETGVQKISLVNDLDNPGQLTFTNFNGETNNVQGGFLPDDETIELDEENQLKVIGVNTGNTVITGEQLEDDLTSIKSIVNAKGGYLDSYNFNTATPTQQQLTDYAIQNIGKDVFVQQVVTSETYSSFRYLFILVDEEFEQVDVNIEPYNPAQTYYTPNIWQGTRVVNLYTNKTTHQNQDTYSWDLNTQYWSNLGNISLISDANNDGLHGLVTGAPNDGDHDYMVNIDMNGQMTVNQLPELDSRVEVLETNLSELVLNEYSDTTNKPYSADYVNSNFAPLSFVSKLYLEKVDSTNTELVNTPPEVSQDNYIEIISSNNTFNWSAPIFTTTRELQANTTLSKETSFSITLNFTCLQDCHVSFGARIKVSEDDGSTWTYISSNQSYGENDYEANSLSSRTFIVYTDSLTTNVNYDLGTLLAIEIFIKGQDTTQLTTDFLFGYTVDNSNIYSYLQFNYSNVSINTEQIEDGAITYEKLDNALQTDIDQITTNKNNISTLSGVVSGIINDNTASSTSTYSSNKINTELSTKSNKGTIKTYTLASADWSSNEQTISITGKTSSWNARVCNWQDGTAQEVLDNSTAIADANIYQIIDNGTSLTFVCETEPTVDIKVDVELFEAEVIVPSINYLTFSSDNSFTLNVADFTKYWDGTLEYSTDKTTWNVWDGTTTLSSGAGNELYLRGTGNTVITGVFIGQDKKRWVLTGNGINCIGNIENLLDYSIVANGGHPPMAIYCFTHLFRYSTSLVSAPSLPATTLSDYCYQQMFQNCTSLVTAPATLPATTLAQSCYSAMFYNCTSLASAPALPATIMESNCYSQMFSLCSSLVTAPALPATTLADYCYYCMFEGCSNLTTISALPATIVAEGCYCNMFAMCTSLTTLPALPATTLPDACYMGMFSQCSEIKISEMPSSEYSNFYQIPISDMGTADEHALDYMFMDTGGEFTGTPYINMPYFTSNAIINPDGTITPAVEVE